MSGRRLTTSVAFIAGGDCSSQRAQAFGIAAARGAIAGGLLGDYLTRSMTMWHWYWVPGRETRLELLDP